MLPPCSIAAMARAALYSTLAANWLSSSRASACQRIAATLPIAKTSAETTPASSERPARRLSSICVWIAAANASKSCARRALSRARFAAVMPATVLLMSAGASLLPAPYHLGLGQHGFVNGHGDLDYGYISISKFSSSLWHDTGLLALIGGRKH